MHNAQSSPWVKVPVSLHEGLDGILVELVCSLSIICIDLLVKCIDTTTGINLRSGAKMGSVAGTSFARHG